MLPSNKHHTSKCGMFRIVIYILLNQNAYGTSTKKIKQWKFSEQLCQTAIVFSCSWDSWRNAWVTQRLKEATKLYFTYYSRVVIILFNRVLYKLAFSTDSFVKLAFCLSALFALCQIRYNLHKLYNICMITAYIVGVRYSVFLCHKHLNTRLKIAFNKKHTSNKLFSV